MTTLVPPQLLNPSGSTAGQVLRSTGPSSIPGWAALVSGDLPTVPVAKGGTGQTSASGAALDAIAGFSFTGYMKRTGAGSYTSVATIPIAEGGTGQTTAAAALTALGGFPLVGTVAGGNAAAGQVGEYLTASNTATSLTTAVAANATSLSLTAGDWEIESVITYVPTGSTNITQLFAGASSTSAAFGGFGSYSKTTYAAAGVVTGNTGITVASPVVRISISATTTVYAVASANFTASTMTCDGFLRARRIR
jgi:hypothetical protein